MPNLPEIILVLLIVLITFGMGKLPQLSNSLARLRSEFRRGLKGEEDGEEGEEPRDITPPRDSEGGRDHRKPGHVDTGIEEARIESLDPPESA